MFGKLLFYSKLYAKRNVFLFSNKKYISDSIVNYKIKTQNNENDKDNNDNDKNIKIKIKLKLKFNDNLMNENDPYNDRED